MRAPDDIREYLGDDGEFHHPVDPQLGVYSARRRGFLRRRFTVGCTALGLFVCVLLLLPHSLG